MRVRRRIDAWAGYVFRVDGDAFFALVEKDRFTAADLDGLAECCPCGLKRSRVEYQYLLDLFFDKE